MNETIKDILKVIEITIIGLVIAIFIYTFTHELGHTIMCIIVGAEVKEFEILPVPHIACNINGLTKNEIIAIGLAGNIIPLIINTLVDTITIKVKRFEIVYYKLYTYSCCWLSMIISAISGAFKIMEQDDIYSIISRYPEERTKCILICIILAVVIMIRIYKMDIKEQFIKFIDE